MSRDIQPDTLSKTPKSRWRRTKPITAAVVATLCLIWFVPWAHVRITTSPARAHDDYSDLFAHFYSSGDDDATDEWLSALAAIPAQPAFDEPPPTGMKWKFEDDSMPYVDITELNTGPWDPPSRPILRWNMRYVASAQLNSALARVVGLRDRPFVFDINWGLTSDASPKVSFSEIRHLAKILCARSRFRSETGDEAGGWNDLETLLIISRTAPQDTLIARLVLTASEARALNELRQYLRVTTIDESLARDIDRVLDSLSTPDQAWREAMSGEPYFDLHEIDLCYSDDGSGNGWLVLSAQPDWKVIGSGSGATASPARSKFWNLLSPLYHDRRTATKRLELRFTRYIAAAEMPYTEAGGWLRAVDLAGAYGPADGPWLHFQPEGTVWRTYQIVVRQFASRQATRIMAALSWFKGEYGHFPARLEELVPKFVPELPIDPFGGEPFGYRRTDDDYLLFSFGTDGDDDGGKPGEGYGGARAFADEGDHIYTLPRYTGVLKEPVAVPLGTRP